MCITYIYDMSCIYDMYDFSGRASIYIYRICTLYIYMTCLIYMICMILQEELHYIYIGYVHYI